MDKKRELYMIVGSVGVQTIVWARDIKEVEDQLRVEDKYRDYVVVKVGDVRDYKSISIS